jgi:hypothetical protein
VSSREAPLGYSWQVDELTQARSRGLSKRVAEFDVELYNLWVQIRGVEERNAEFTAQNLRNSFRVIKREG